MLSAEIQSAKSKGITEVIEQESECNFVAAVQINPNNQSCKHPSYFLYE